MGGHGDTMDPLPRYTSICGIPLTELMTAEDIEKIVQRTRKGGGELVQLMGTSAWYAPGAAAAQMAEAIVDDQKRIFPVSTILTGQFGLKDVFMGMPVKLGKDGIEEVIDIKLGKDELILLQESAKAVKNVMDVFDGMNII